MSPHLFSLLPAKDEEEDGSGRNKKLLSPTLFSFQRGDGLLSLPSLFGVSVNECVGNFGEIKYKKYIKI